jgi:hypothetical protein
MAVHCLRASDATAAFLAERTGNRDGHCHGDGSAPTHFSRDRRKRRWALHGHRHGRGGALPYFPRDYVFGDLTGMVTATPMAVPPPPYPVPQRLRWFSTVGSSPPCLVPGTDLSGDLAEIAPRGIRGLFACVAINRGCGRPW